MRAARSTWPRSWTRRTRIGDADHAGSLETLDMARLGALMSACELLDGLKEVVRATQKLGVYPGTETIPLESRAISRFSDRF